MLVGSPTMQADGADAGLGEIAQQHGNAEAADLLVIGEREVERRAQPCAAIAGARAMATATKPFMSQAPRP